MSLLSRLWARRRERPALVAVAALLAASLSVYPVLDWWLRANVEFASAFRFGDFGAYTGAVDRWQAGESLYRRTEAGGFWGTYLYPPVVVLLFWPFEALLAFRDGAMAWLLAGFHPALLTAKLGQTALFTGGLLSFAAAALVRDDRSRRRTAEPSDADLWDRPLALLSGAATAVVGVVKFAYAPVGAHLLHDRRRLVGALLVVPPVAWLSIRFFGIDAHLTYLDVLQWGVSQGSDGARSPTLWLAPYYKPLAWVPAAQALRLAASAGVAGLAVLAPQRARRKVFALGIAAFPLLTPQTYAYYFVALLPAAVVLLAGELDGDGSPELVLLGVLLVHLHSYGLRVLVVTVPNAVPAFEALEPVYLLLQPGLWGNAVLVGLAAVRVVQATAVPELAADRLPAGDTSTAGPTDGD